MISLCYQELLGASPTNTGALELAGCPPEMMLARVSELPIHASVWLLMPPFISGSVLQLLRQCCVACKDLHLPWSVDGAKAQCRNIEDWLAWAEIQAATDTELSGDTELAQVQTLRHQVEQWETTLAVIYC